MPLTALHIALFFAAGTMAGAINAIAGGGSLLSFPTLIFAGVPSLIANGTNTMALFPGAFSAYWQFRGETAKGGSYWLWLGIPSLVGGTAGAAIAIRVGDKAFEHLVPWLVLVATTLFIMQEPIRRLTRRREEDITETKALPTLLGVMTFQLLVGLYGGFFGAGNGILMLASFGLLGIRNIHKLNGLKNLSAVFINSAASIMFAVRRQVDWPIALLMMVGAILGGYAGATISQKLSQKLVKNIIIVIGLAIAAAMFVKEFHRS